MRYHPNLILLKVFKRYLNIDERIDFENKISRASTNRENVFMKTMIKYFDLEKLKNNPIIWQDIWIYNYCKYEVSNGLRKSGLIKKYEQKAFILKDVEFWKRVDIKTVKKE
jgi:hypothetical protein